MTRTARAGRELGAPGLPTTVVIDRTGQEVGRLLGPAEWDSEEALALPARPGRCRPPPPTERLGRGSAPHPRRSRCPSTFCSAPRR